MNTTPLWLAGLILLPLSGLAIWAWRALAELEQSLQSVADFEGMHFEIGAYASDRPSTGHGLEAHTP